MHILRSMYTYIKLIMIIIIGLGDLNRRRRFRENNRFRTCDCPCRVQCSIVRRRSRFLPCVVCIICVLCLRGSDKKLFSFCALLGYRRSFRGNYARRANIGYIIYCLHFIQLSSRRNTLKGLSIITVSSLFPCVFITVYCIH